jgi:hypothetical protein
MDEIAPLGPRPYNLKGLTDEQFEELCFRLALVEVPGLSRTANPDGGADAILRSPGGGFARAFQVKHHTSGISWPKCRDSLDRVIETYGVEQVTFCFPLDLGMRDHLRFDRELCRRHPEVRIDSWDASQIRARLTVSKQGERAARYFFGDPSCGPELLARMVRAGGPLQSVGDAIERLRPVGEFLDDHDPHFTYPQSQYPAGTELPPTPGAVISLESRDGNRMVRIDAVPRDAEAAERYRPTFQVAFCGEEGQLEAKRFEQALARGRPIKVSAGVSVTFQRMPPAFAGQVGEPFAAEVRIGPQALAPWSAEFSVRAAGGEERMVVEMAALEDPPEDWDVVYQGRFGGICATVSLRDREDGAALALNWCHTLPGSPARDQLQALRFLAALVGEGTFTLIDRNSRTRLIHEPTKPEAIDERLPRLIEVMGDLVEIEDWTGVELGVPTEISAAELEAIFDVAAQIRARQVPFRARKLSLVGPGDVIPQLVAGENIEITDTWVAEILGEELALAQRTVTFPGVEVVDHGEVEPGRHSIDLHPAPGVPAELLRWELAPPAKAA